MLYSDNAINILTTKTYKGIGRAWIVKNIKGNEQLDMIVSLLNRDAKENYHITLENFLEKRRIIKRDILEFEGSIDGIVALGDDNFPPYRGKVKNSEQPVVIFYRGDISLLNASNKNIAVIGLLNPDQYIEIIEREVVAALVKNGATIVSGLALGCDSIAHTQALHANGKTVAILPGPLNNILPTKNIQLAEEIVIKNGLLITEYYVSAQSAQELKGRYQERDRLQAMFSDNIILSASYSKNKHGNDSGSRFAIEYALSYSIPISVIYDIINDENNEKYDLNRQIIKEKKDVTIINRNNLFSSVQKILSNKPAIKNDKQYQHSLLSFSSISDVNAF